MTRGSAYRRSNNHMIASHQTRSGSDRPTIRRAANCARIFCHPVHFGEAALGRRTVQRPIDAQAGLAVAEITSHKQTGIR